ncbi:hypothetical protein AKO1_014213 [Acrasis kona]|uniref:Radial spoke protein 3 n=1 Tax=Acrasis kona TaxID=1008807 RepID=A0AAW2Z0A8_9EUKA
MTPLPIEGRKHTEIQTDRYLEEVSDHVKECEAFTQTDPFMDRPESPLYLPTKSGLDVAVQVEEDLFHFDSEVDPILEVLIGKTLEQSMLEVMQEEEMQNIENAQREFEQARNERLNATQVLEADERRRFEEKQRRKEQERQRLQRESTVKQKLSSRTFSKLFLSNLEGRVFDTLERQGFFYDVVQRDIEVNFMPWLTEKVQDITKTKENGRSILDALIKNTIRDMLRINKEAKDERLKREEQERIQLEEERLAAIERERILEQERLLKLEEEQNKLNTEENAEQQEQEDEEYDE